MINTGLNTCLSCREKENDRLVDAIINNKFISDIYRILTNENLDEDIQNINIYESFKQLIIENEIEYCVFIEGNTENKYFNIRECFITYNRLSKTYKLNEKRSKIYDCEFIENL